MGETKECRDKGRGRTACSALQRCVSGTESGSSWVLDASGASLWPRLAQKENRNCAFTAASSEASCSHPNLVSASPQKASADNLNSSLRKPSIPPKLPLLQQVPLKAFNSL
jgi:hypothetical protein